jgi:hypothetical protein
MLFLGAMVDALAALIGQTRIPAAPIILPHSPPDSIGRVKLSINRHSHSTKSAESPTKNEHGSCIACCAVFRSDLGKR